MEEYQRVLINILKSSINNKKVDFIENNVNWSKLIDEGKNHELSSLLYYSLDKSILYTIDNSLLDRWKKEVFLSNMIQIKHFNQISKVISRLKENNLEVIILKGLYLRNLYPKSELRTMGDADILVKPCDYENAKKILLNMGYECRVERSSIHEVFQKDGSLNIELHNALIDDNIIEIKCTDFQDNLWSNSEKIYFNGIETNMLGKEDFLFHLCIHMVVHSKYSGFGLRQLYDLALFLKKNKDEINWKDYYEKLYKYGILKFVQGILLIINDIFEINLNSILLKNIVIKDSYIKLLLDNIILAGVHGKKNLKSDFEALYKNQNYHNDNEKLYKKIIRFIFPKPDEMGEKYIYAKKYWILISIAWIHRIFNGVFKKYGLFNTVNNIMYSLKIRYIRIRIIKSFDIPR